MSAYNVSTSVLVTHWITRLHKYQQRNTHFPSINNVTEMKQNGQTLLLNYCEKILLFKQTRKTISI